MLSISCPEAARLLLTRTEPLTFVTTRDDAPPEPNDLDGDLYHLVDRSRAAALSLLQDRTRPLSDRLALVLELGWRLEPLIDAARWDAGHRLLDRYGLRAYRGKRLTYLRRKRRGGDLAPVRDLLRSLEPLSPAAPNCYAALAKPDLAAAEIPRAAGGLFPLPLVNTRSSVATATSTARPGPWSPPCWPRRG